MWEVFFVTCPEGHRFIRRIHRHHVCRDNPSRFIIDNKTKTKTHLRKFKFHEFTTQDPVQKREKCFCFFEM